MNRTEGQQARAVKKVRVPWHERVEDPRDRRGRRHKHHGLLNLLVASFAAGQTTRTFTVPVFPDIAVEGNETVLLSLSSPTGGAILGPRSTATLTIVDND